MTLITSDMRAAVDRELSRRVSFPVSESDIRRWVVAVYWPHDPPRELWDVDYGDALLPHGFAAPAEFNPFAWMVASSEERVEAPPISYRYRLNGGVSMEYGAHMRPGDVITSVRSMASYDERDSKRGPMLLATSRDRWTNQRGDLVRLHYFTAINYV
jgi:hypothetical protein